MRNFANGDIAVFLLKKWLGGLLKPLPFSLILLTFGLLLLIMTSKQRFGKFVLSLGLITLLAFSSEPVSGSLIASLERQYPAFNIEQKVDTILVLGHGGLADPDLAITGQLSGTAIARFAEAFRIWQANPQAIIVVSGSNFGDSKTHAELMATLALSFGVPEAQIKRLDHTRDTPDEAKEMALLIKGKQAALVTSASHMPRAMKLFAMQNSQPIAAPAYYKQRNSTLPEPSNRMIPSAYYLERSEMAVHEYLGIWWSELRQNIK
nr:envelope biogenesis factor ElyC [Motilimonas cestriensis]